MGDVISVIQGKLNKNYKYIIDIEYKIDRFTECSDNIVCALVNKEEDRNSKYNLYLDF